jgi:hypothetical protein
MPNIRVSPPSAASRISNAKDEPTSKKDVNNEKLMVRIIYFLLPTPNLTKYN